MDPADTLRAFTAPNPGPFTLDGTRTHLVGRREVAVVDPGPDDPRHREVLLAALASARTVAVVLTHHHPDHAAGARALADALAAPVWGPGGSGEAGEGGSPPAGGPPRPGVDRVLEDGDGVPTDAGELVTLTTPGHAREHLAFHWPGARVLFPGDLLMGEGYTTWVGAYAGAVADYLRSLDRLEALEPRVDAAFPAHGPPIRPFAGTVARYRAHRESRICRTREVLERNPDATAEEVREAVYGRSVPPGLERAALRSAEALLHHVRGRSPDGP